MLLLGNIKTTTMKTKQMLFTAWIISALSSCQPKTEYVKLWDDSLRADSVMRVERAAKGPTADTDGYTGRWRAQYPYYAKTVEVTLDIEKTATASCSEYSCSWSSWQAGDFQPKTDHKEYQWCAQDENTAIVGTTKMEKENTVVTIMKNGNHLSVIIKYPNQEEPWTIDFAR
jgi:hypothetical protein